MSGDTGGKTQDLSIEEIEAELKYHGLEIVRLISDKGGMADVYEAWQPSVRRRVAAKRLKSHLVADPEVRARFEEEALLLGRLNHPNIVQVIDYSNEKLTLFMEFIDGEPLDEVLAERGRLPLEEALRVTAGVLDALAYAHARNIIHRDVKPGNIFLTREGLVKLGDFGIAAIIGAEARQGGAGSDSWVGTPAYVAPEQITGDAVDGRADVYAVGATLFLLLTGRLPFVGETNARTASLRLTRDPEAPSALNPALPPEVDAVVLKALARSPAERFGSAAEFKDAVNALLAPHRDLAYLQEARAELEKAGRAAAADRKRLLVNGVKLSQMALAESPGHPEAAALLVAAQAGLLRIRRRERAAVGGTVAVAVAVIALLAALLLQGKGSLDVFTNEPADVYLDGAKIGAAPFVFTDIPAGNHRLYVEQPDFYRSAEREVRIEKGAVVSVSEPIPDGGIIIVSSAEPGSAVRLDGKEIGTTPLTRKVVVGNHVLEVAGAKKEIVILANKTRTFSFAKR